MVLDGDFGPYFLGKLLANTGIWVHNIASASLLWTLTQSAFLVGAVSFALFTPQLVFAPLSGAMADRGDPRRQLIVGRTLCSLGAGGLTAAVVLAPELDVVPAWLVLVTSLAVGIGFTIGGPAMQSLLPTLVRPVELPRAVGLDNLGFAVGRAVGPATGGVVAAALGYGWAFVIATVGQLAFLAAVVRLRTSTTTRAEGSASSVRAGLAHVRSDPVVAALILGVSSVGVGADPALTLAPALSASFGRGPEVVGLFASAFGAGAFVAYFVHALTQRWIGGARYACVGLGLLGLSAAALVFSTTVPLAATAFAVGGTGMTFALTSFTTLLYARVPPELVGRVMALWLVGFVGSRPLAAGLNGLLADVVSVEAALLATSLLVVTAAWFCRPSALERPVPGGG